MGNPFLELTKKEMVVLMYCVSRGSGLYKAADMEKDLGITRANRFLNSLAKKGYLTTGGDRYGVKVGLVAEKATLYEDLRTLNAASNIFDGIERDKVKDSKHLFQSGDDVQINFQEGKVVDFSKYQAASNPPKGAYDTISNDSTSDKKPSRAMRRLNYFKRKYFERYGKEYYEPSMSQKALLGIIKKLEDRGLLEGYEEAVDIYFVRTRIGHSLKDFSKDGVLKDVLAVMSRERKAAAEPEREEVDINDEDFRRRREEMRRRKMGMVR